MFFLYWWNWWPSQFKHSFHNLRLEDSSLVTFFHRYMTQINFQTINHVVDKSLYWEGRLRGLHIIVLDSIWKMGRWWIGNYTNIPCDCGQYTRIFSRDTLNCMDVLYCPTSTVEGNITHPCNSRYRGKMFLYIDHSHIEYLLYYILIVKIINQNSKKFINKC